MISKGIAVLNIIILLFSLAVAGQAGERGLRILLVYDRTSYFGEKTDQVGALKKILEKFSPTVDTCRQEEYQKGRLDDYDWLFYLSLDGYSISPELLQDLGTSTKSIVYLGKGLNKYLVQYPDHAITGVSSEIVEVFYQGSSYPLDYPEQLNLFNSQQGKWYGKLTDGTHYWPYLLRVNNFWYGAGFRADTGLAHVLEKVLTDIIGPPLEKKPLSPIKAKQVEVKEKEDYFGIGVNLFSFLLGGICLIFSLILLISRLKNRRNIFVKAD